MKIRGALIIIMLGTLTALRGAEPAIEFSGVLTTDGATKVALTNKATGATTWVEAGEKFLGYTVARYEAKDDAVFLRKNGQEIRISLSAAKTPVSTTAATPSPEAAATANTIRGNLRMLAAAARRYQNEHGSAVVTYADLVGPGKYIKELPPVAGENYANLSFAPNTTTVSIAMPDGTPLSVELAPASLPATNALAGQPANPAAGSTTATPIATPPPVTMAPSVSAAPAPTPPPQNAPLPPAIAANPPPADAASTPPVSSETLEPTGRAPAATTYTTANDDTWETIAQKTGVSVQKLKEVNSPIPSGSSLPPGQTIRLK